MALSENCPTCEQPIGELRDDASKREAAFSGLCQGCQDDYFGVESEKVATIEDFPVTEEVAEKVPAESKLPDWIEDSWA